MTDSDWLEIVIPAPSAGAEEVAALIPVNVEAAHDGTELRSNEVVFWVPVERGEEVLLETRAAVRRLAAVGFAVDPAKVRARPALPEKEWRDAWKKYFHVTRLTRQLVIVPSWESHDGATPGDLIIDLDPGQAFGTGAHGSTRLVLHEMQAARDNGFAVRRFLDVGAGSGILSIAAAKLWPDSTGMALDIDPIAVAAAKENCAKNHVAARVDCVPTPITEIEGGFDIVVANIQAEALDLLCAPISARIAPRGILIISGLLRDQVEAVAGQYAGRPHLSLTGIRCSEDDPEFCSARLDRVSLVRYR